MAISEVVIVPRARCPESFIAEKRYKAGEKLVDIAQSMGKPVGTVRRWKSDQDWDGKKKQTERSDIIPNARKQKRTLHAEPSPVFEAVANAVEENDELTDKQKLFCVIYLTNFNATLAYLKAYGCSYETANRCGPRLMVNVRIQEEVRELKKIKNAVLGGLCGEDVVELHMRIAFGNMKDFVKSGSRTAPVLNNGRPVMIEHPKTGEKKMLTQVINEVRLIDSNMVDGQLITEISEGREGVKIKLAEKHRSLAFLERYFELYPMDRHRKEYDRQRLALERAKNEAEHAVLHGTAETAATYRGLPASSIGKAYLDIDRDINARRHTRYDFKGGRGSLKSSYCALKLVDLIMLNEAYCGLVVRAVRDTLRDSVYAQVTWAIDELGLTELFRCTVSPMQITRKDTGQVIYFRGADDPGKIKSIKPPKDKYIGIVWGEEKDQIGPETWRNILQSAFRGGSDGLTFSSYNTPISQQHYINKEALVDDPQRVIHHSYYTDAPPEWLGPAFFDLAEHLKATNERAFRHEYLGEATGTGANVFENVTLRRITDEEIAGFDRVYPGLDWGYFPHPAAFNAHYYHSASQKLYIFGEVTALKASNEKLAGMIGDEWKDTHIIADSAEPKSIQDFRDLGFWISGAKKGKGSVEHGMKWVASRAEIIIDQERCPNAAVEFVSYEHPRDKDGNIISGYVDKDDHSISNCRYALEEVIRQERWER